MTTIEMCPICGIVPAILQHEHSGEAQSQVCPIAGCRLPVSMLHDHVEKYQHTRDHLEGKRCPICGIAAVIDHTHAGGPPPVVSGNLDGSLLALRPALEPPPPPAPPPDAAAERRMFAPALPPDADEDADDDEPVSEHDRPTTENL